MSRWICSSSRRCRRRECAHCGPIRQGDEFRKYLANLREFGGRFVVVAVTAPGVDVLPWDRERCLIEGPHKCTGTVGCRVVGDVAEEWNADANDRYQRMWKAATIAADRWVRRVHGSHVKLPRRVACAWSPQRRGVWHVHEALPYETHVERQWSRVVVEYVDRKASSYGWGNLDRNPLREGGRAADRAASYLAFNASAYLSENANERTLPGRQLRSYVARRLTMKTGVTIRNLRRVRYLYVCIRQSLPLPEWSPAELELVWSLIAGVEVAALGP